MLISQLETLEPLGPDEDGVIVDIDASREEIVDRALGGLGLRRSSDASAGSDVVE
jgi:gluconokinase